MKKILFLVLLLAYTTVFANQLDSIQSYIPISPALNTSDPSTITYAQQYLFSKINKEIAKTGTSGYSGADTRFILLITPNVVDKTQNGQVILMKLSFDLSVIDLYEKFSYGNLIVPTAGAGRNENEAVIDAYRRVNFEKSDLQKFIEAGRTKILDYYKYKCESIVEKAKTLINTKQFEESIAILNSIPDLPNPTCRLQINATLQEAYAKYLNFKCQAAISKAKIAWATSPNTSGAEQVGSILAEVTLTETQEIEAKKLITEIKAKLLNQGKKEWDFQMRTYKDRIKLESERTNAYKTIAAAYYNSQKPTNYIFFR